MPTQHPHTTPPYFIGLMSGTSLDGVDGVIATFNNTLPTLIATHYLPFLPPLREELMALQTPTLHEIERAAKAGQTLARYYAQCVTQLLTTAKMPAQHMRAIGAHGQTIRHCPEQHFTWQINDPALLAELTGIDVIADFRRRDIAAGGQGAPLVPAFHHAVFAHSSQTRVIINIGGIANISILHPETSLANAGQPPMGFDTGPGNVLMDLWASAHLGKPYDDAGAWAKTGQCHLDLLNALKNESYFALPAPKSTGRDLFNMPWLQHRLKPFLPLPVQDVQATLNTLTATTIVDAIARYAKNAATIYVCGGGAFNQYLMQKLSDALVTSGLTMPLTSTQALGFSPQHMEAVAFAWLAWRFCQGLPGNLPMATGAKGWRILGARYPA